MSAAQTATSGPDRDRPLAGLVAALAGGRRSGSGTRRPVARLRRKPLRGTGAETRGALTDAVGEPTGTGHGPEQEQPGREKGRTGGPTSSSARARRREVEAELIGLHRSAGRDPAWWEPCWLKGLDSELSPEHLFDALATLHPEVRVLHRLGVAGSPSVIDHVLVGPGGVVVADTETSTGRVRTDGVHLRVRGRDRSPIVDVALWQAEVIRTTLAQRGLRDIPVHGVLHWHHLDGLGDRPICLRGVPLLSAGAAMGLAVSGIWLSPLSIERATAALMPAVLQR